MSEDTRFILQTLEGMSKRIRFLETLPRPTSSVVDTFLELADTPSVYAGHGGFAVFVNPAEDGLRFDPVGGACVAFVCGPVGWRATGGTIPRTLVHETAFQLSADGDDRGAYAIDLQQVRFKDADVAGAEFSAILGNEENEIGVDADWSTITGSYNAILDSSAGCHHVGQFSDVHDGSYSVHCTGEVHDIDAASWAFFSGYGHGTSITGGASLSCVGVFSFIEQNEFIGTLAGDYPTYTGSFGLSLVQRGDVWYGFQFGEDCEIYGLTGGNMINMQYGYNHYSEEAFNVFQFGYATKSVQAPGVDFYDGRIVWSGEWPNASPSDGTGWPGGYNQDSLFSQNDNITTWNVAWTTSRFEFPIIQESVWGFTAYIIGTERFAANIYSWKIEGLIKNAGGVTTLIWSVVTNNFRDVVTKEWQVIADNPNDRLVFQFRDTAGPDATICNIQLMLLTVEVGYN